MGTNPQLLKKATIPGSSMKNLLGNPLDFKKESSQRRETVGTLPSQEQPRQSFREQAQTAAFKKAKPKGATAAIKITD